MDIQEMMKNYQRSQDRAQYSQILSALLDQETIWYTCLSNPSRQYIEWNRGKASACIFTKYEYAVLFQDYQSKNSLSLEIKENKSQERTVFFMELLRCGFELVIVDNGQTYLGCSLSDFFGKSTLEEVVADKAVIYNPVFWRYALFFFQNLSCRRATREMEADMLQAFYRGTFLMPVADPGTHAAGGEAYTIDSVSHLLISTNGEDFYPVFTDRREMAQLQLDKTWIPMAARFDDMKKLTKSASILVNPHSIGLPVNSSRFNAIEEMMKPRQ